MSDIIRVWRSQIPVTAGQAKETHRLSAGRTVPLHPQPAPFASKLKVRFLRFQVRILLTFAHAAFVPLDASAGCQLPDDSIAPFSGRVDECRCGAALRNVTVTVPKSLVLKTVCGLRSDEHGKVQLKHQRVNLDHYDKHGNYFSGTFLFAGELRLKGVLRYQPSDGGDFFFTPHVPLINTARAFASHLSVFNLTARSPRRGVVVPSHVLQQGCAQAEARIRIRGIQVLVDESEAAGAYPMEFDVLDIASFKPCQD